MEKSQPPPYSANPPPPGFVNPNQPPHHPHHHHGPPPPPLHTTHQNTVIVTNVQTSILGPTPTHLTCPSCHATITSTVETHANTKTHLFAFLCFIFGCWCCCCLPYCMDSCQSQTHTCPNCGAFLGEYNN